MWIVADLEKLKESNSTAAVPIIQATGEPPPADAPKVEIKGTPVKQTKPDKASEDVLKEDIKNKLRYLKELLDEGLISEKDYTVKKMELLDRIK